MAVVDIIKAIPWVGDVFTGVIDIIKEFVPDKDKQAEIQERISSAFLVAYQKASEWKAQVLQEALTKGSSVERAFRGIVVLIFTGIEFNELVIIRYTPLINPDFQVVPLEIWQHVLVWVIIYLGVTGYVPEPGTLGKILDFIKEHNPFKKKGDK